MANGGGGDWRIRRPGGDLEISLHPAPGDGGERDATLLELRRLMWDFKHRDPQARQVVSSIHARLGGFPALPLSRDMVDLDVASPQTDAIARDLLRAVGSGVLLLRRREQRSVVVPLDEAGEEALGPQAGSQDVAATQSWIGMTLVDQDGTPVPNRAYRIVLPDGSTRDGTLDSNGAAMIQGLDPGNCQIWCPYVEPHPETTYTVQPGDHVSGIAESFGFDDYSTVWGDPGNADLQQLRTDPHVLQPGDQLTVPELKAQAAANKPTGAKHPFQIQRSALKLRLTLLDLAVKAMANVAVTVAGTSLTTDGDGLVEATIDKSARETTLQEPAGDPVGLVVGGLNPSDDSSVAGYKARLYNMGFLWDPTVPDTADEMVIALQDFQAQYKLTLSGELDDATKAQLLTSHGC
ncbi:MAG: LysM domain-containing protein [Polyangiaceae bacterium]